MQPRASGPLIEFDGDGNPTGVIRESEPLALDTELPAQLLQKYEMEDIPNLMLSLGYTSIDNITAWQPTLRRNSMP